MLQVESSVRLGTRLQSETRTSGALTEMMEVALPNSALEWMSTERYPLRGLPPALVACEERGGLG